MGHVAAEKGYASATVADVIARAGVSRATYYEHFADKEACFLAAFDAGVDLLLTTIGEALDEVRGAPVERLDRVLGAYLDALAAEPDFAKTFLVEVYAAGPRAIARRAELQLRFVDTVAAVLGAGDAAPGSTERFACEALVASISALVTSRVGSGHPEELAALRAPFVDLVRRARLAP